MQAELADIRGDELNKHFRMGRPLAASSRYLPVFSFTPT